MNAEPKFEVGQTVLLFSYRREPRGVTVTRVGRKNVYVTVGGREYPFNMETGQEVRSPNAGGIADCIRTFEWHAEHERRVAVREALDRQGFRPVGYGDYRQDTATLERLLAVLGGVA